MAYTKVRKDKAYDTTFSKEVNISEYGDTFFSKGDIDKIYTNQRSPSTSAAGFVEVNVTGLSMRTATLTRKSDGKKLQVLSLIGVNEKDDSGTAFSFEDHDNVFAVGCGPLRIKTSVLVTYERIFTELEK